MPMDRFILRRGDSLPDADSLLPFELGFCKENSALYIGGEAGPIRLTFPETLPEPPADFINFPQPVDAEQAPLSSLFTDADGHLCFKNPAGETTILI